MKNRLLGREVLALTKIVDKDGGYNREGLTFVHIGKDYAEATDGRLLVKVPVKVDDGEFPEINGIEETSEDVLIPAETLKKAFAQAPKNAALPILNNVMLGKRGDKNVLVATDLESTSEIEIPHTDEHFPDTETVLTFPEKGHLQVRLSEKVLQNLLDFMKVAGKDKKKIYSINFTFYNGDGAVKIRAGLDDGEAVGAMMPMKKD